MRFLLALALVALVVVAPLGPARAGATLDRVRAAGTVTTLVIDDYPPFGFINAENALDGFDIDTAKAVAERLGVQLKLATPGWETIVSGRWQGRWDLCICSMSPTAERAKVLNFPALYYSSPAWLVVHQDEQAIRSIADISGKRVGVGTGSTYETYVNKTLVIPGGAPVAFPFQDVLVVPGDETVNFRNLALGPGVRLDAIIADLATARGYIAATHALKLVGGPLYREPNAVATDPGDPEWDAEIARVIGDLQADGTLARIARKWVGTDISRDEP